MEKKKKEMEQAAAETRKLIIKAMKEQGIKSFENDLLKMTYIAPFEKESIDTARLKKELPEIAKKYLKQSQVKESVRITLRGTE
jgi:predicted phage-related endonuclease